MYCIQIDKQADGYTIIRVTDDEGIVCSYCGYDNWPAHCLQAEHNITV